MSNQEMQFADPDWKPSQQLDSNANQQEQGGYTPQPINDDARDQNKWGSSPSSYPQQEGYTGLRPYAGQVPGQWQGGNYRQRPYSRRGRGPLFWIILAFIIFSLIGGGSRFSNSFSSENGTDFGHSSYTQPMMVKPFVSTVNGQANIVINDPNGNVTVTEGQSNSVIIQPMNGNSFPGDPNDIQQSISQNGNTITAYIPTSQDLQVTVPQGANLTLNTGSGDINFDGTFPTTGTAQFQTTNGDITITVPSNSAFHLNASTNSGSISSDFPNVNGQSVNTIVGGNTHSQVPNVVITSDSGNINLNTK